tara:strand:- start:610 stop:1326 length:717 start_codon:yes stop_codon:yes gene_type:complete
MSGKYIIFGATGATGTALAHQMYEDQKECHLVGRNEKELGNLSSACGYNYSVCNVLDINFTDQLVKDLSSTQILGIAYCVGSINLKPLKSTLARDFISSYVLNVVSVTEIIKAFQENLKKNNGSIVLFSTIAARRGFINHSIISSAKAAIEGLTVSLAAELAPKIRINCIAPSLTKSKISNFLFENKKNIEAVQKLHPLKRLGEGKDIASLAKFLLYPENSWITGQVIGIDGGRATIA